MNRRGLIDVAVLGGILLALVGLIGIFAWFWIPPTPTEGSALARYAPMPTGDAQLRVELDSDGSPHSWISGNVRIIPWLRLFNELGFATSAGISQTYLDSSTPGSLTFEQARTAASIVGVNRRQLDGQGSLNANTLYYLREPRGLLLAGSDPGSGTGPRFFEPPVVILPPDVSIGETWTGTGRLGSAPYLWSAMVESRGPLTARSGAYDDCLQVKSEFSVGQGSPPPFQSSNRDWYCADVGLVATDSVSNGGPVVRTEIAGPGDLPPPPAAPADDTVAAPEPDLVWEVERFGDTSPLGLASAGTIPPVWLAGDPPLLLAAEQGGDLVAFQADSDMPTVAWRFHPGGSVYGAPAVDEARGRIYFGAADKTIYALDQRGLFLWSFTTRDTVGTTPIIAEDLVIVGGDDHTLYALDADSGQLQWSAQGGGPIASSPALLGSTIVIASDDQGVYGVDLHSGQMLWTFVAPSPVEAAVVGIDDSHALISSRDGSLTLLDIASCSDGCDAVWSTSVGAAIRRAPAVLGDTAFVVDDDGALNAIDLEQGKRLWTRELELFVGSPLALGDSIVVARNNGSVAQFATDGTALSSWNINGARSPVDAERQLTLGPSVGGNAVWLADRVSVLWRIGPKLTRSVTPLRLEWLFSRSRLRGEFDRFLSTPLSWQGKIVVLDSLKRAATLNRETGALSPLGALPGNDPLGYIEPTLAGDRLVAVAGTSLVSLNLSGAPEAWQVASEGRTWRPPATSDSAIAWLTSFNNGTTARLQVLDAETGAERWSVPLENFFVPGGAVIADQRVISSTPPAAFDLGTGRRLWQANLPGLGIGGPGLNARADTVYVGYVDTQRVVNGLAAIDVASGRPLWTSELLEAPLATGDAPRASGGTVVVPLSSGVIVGLDAATGVMLWKYQPPFARMGSLEVDQGLVWLMTENARVLVLDAETGTLAGQYSSINQNVGSPTFLQRPLVQDGRAIIPMGEFLLGLDSPQP